MSVRGVKERKRVVIYTQSHRIEGEMYLQSATRLTDELNVQNRSFIAVTSAKVYSLSGDAFLHSVDYLNVNKSSVEMLFEVGSDEVEVSLHR